ncbi:MAG: DUF2510 domain-containing protein [Gordonia amarae]
MAKKKTSNVYVTVELADGQVIVVEADAKQEGKAREFAAALTSAAAVATRTPGGSGPAAPDVIATVTPAAIPSSPPLPSPPVPVPAGWYPDPQNVQLQRYWDGGQWTEHTAPIASQ